MFAAWSLQSEACNVKLRLLVVKCRYLECEGLGASTLFQPWTDGVCQAPLRVFVRKNYCFLDCGKTALGIGIAMR